MSESSAAVFLSYASQDSDAAGRICDALRAAGIEVWFDQSELRGGDAWDAAIRKQIKACALFVPILSETTRSRAEGYFRLEWRLAIDRSRLMADDQAFLLPIVIDGTTEADSRVPERFREVHWTRLSGGQTPAAFIEQVKRLLCAGNPAELDAGIPAAGTATPNSAPGRGQGAQSQPDVSARAQWRADGVADPSTADQAAGGLAADRSGNLPALLPELFGRDEDLDSLRSLVEAHRVVSIVGAGGMGKTRLAQASAHRLRGNFPDGVWMVELAPLADPALLPAAAAQALGIALPGLKPALEEAVDALSDRALLLVLDNCEHLVDAASQFVEALLERASGVRVLATSQELLKVRGEHLYRLASLAIPESHDVATAARSGAVALFIDRVTALQPSFTLTQGNVDDVIDICRRLDGLPLAIEMAAGRVPLLGTAGVRERLHERFRMLTGGARVALRRHQTLRETLEWSHGLLSEPERAVYRRLGVFAGSFTLDTTQEAVTDAQLDPWAVLNHLGGLVDKSLVVAEPGEPPRYRLLETARAFALEKLREAGETDATLRRHAFAMLDIFKRADRERFTNSTRARLDRYLPDLDNLRAALDWSVATADAADLEIELTGAAAWIWTETGQRPEGMRRGEHALARIRPATPPAVEALLQASWYTVAYPRNGAPELAALQRAVELYRTLDDRQALFRSLSSYARALAFNLEFTRCDVALLEADALWSNAWPSVVRWPWLVAKTCQYWMQGRHADVEILAHECHNLAISIGDIRLIFTSLIYLEQAAFSLGRYEEAVERGRDMIARANSEKFSMRLGVPLNNLTNALVETGRFDEALETGRLAFAYMHKEDELLGGLDPIALLAFKRGRFADAARVVGHTDARYARLTNKREPNEQRARDKAMAGLSERLPPDDLERHLLEGAAMSDEEVARNALAA